MNCSEPISKHTPGPWHIRAIPQGMMADICIEGKPEPVATTAFLGWSKSEMEANARLIAEAGTVATETGLTPRQLAEVNRELVELLGDFVAWDKTYPKNQVHSKTGERMLDDLFIRAIASLARAKGAK